MLQFLSQHVLQGGMNLNQDQQGGGDSGYGGNQDSGYGGQSTDSGYGGGQGTDTGYGGGQDSGYAGQTGGQTDTGYGGGEGELHAPSHEECFSQSKLSH